LNKIIFNRYSVFIFIILFASLVSFSSCTDTNNNDDANIDDFVGTWNVSDQSSRLNYQITVQQNPSNSSEILIKNFADLGSSAVALVVGSSIVIDQQSLGSGYTTSGSGSLQGTDKLIINFSLDDGIDNVSRVATCTR
jgi:hypothetical protein